MNRGIIDPKRMVEWRYAPCRR